MGNLVSFARSRSLAEALAWITVMAITGICGGFLLPTFQPPSVPLANLLPVLAVPATFAALSPRVGQAYENAIRHRRWFWSRLTFIAIWVGLAVLPGWFLFFRGITGGPTYSFYLTALTAITIAATLLCGPIPAVVIALIMFLSGWFPGLVGPYIGDAVGRGFPTLLGWGALILLAAAAVVNARRR